LRLAAVAFFVLAFPLAALAEGEVMAGTLISRQGQDRVPVAGVTIVVSQDGTEIGRATSDDQGAWEVPLPGGGTYSVKLDVTTLPEGVALTDPTKEELPSVSVLDGQRKTVLFPLGEGTVSTVTTYQRVMGLFIAGLKLGAIIAMAAVGLSLVYGVTKLVNFAHGEMVTLGAVLAYLFHATDGWPMWPLLLAAIPAVLLTAGFGGLQELALWRPLRRRRTDLIAMMVVSIGLAFAVRSLIQIFFGGLPRSYPQYAGQAPIPFLGVSVPPKQLITILVALVVLAGVGLFLQKTRAGTAMRAISDDPDLAESSGIDADRVILFTWLLAGGLAGMAGVFFGVNESVTYDMGFTLLLLMFAAVVLGGLGTAYGTMLGGFIVGVAVEMSTLFVPSELKSAVGLVILIVMLLVRPQGILGTRERIG
jgi:branched-chain amino acid transport system permease protein